MTTKFESNRESASIHGVNGERLEIEIDQPQLIETDSRIRCWSTKARIRLGDVIPKIDQSVSSSMYHLPKIETLSELVAGDSSKQFVFDTLHFHLNVFEIRMGVRSGFLVDATSTTILDSQFSPWPSDQEIAEYLLLEAPAAGMVRIAFLVEQEQLAKFHKELLAIYRRVSSSDEEIEKGQV